MFDKSQQDALAYVLIRMHGRGLDVASIFWGLWLFPFAMLVIESGFIPRILGYLMMLAGFGYLLNVTTVILAPEYAHLVGDITMILGLGELPIMFWLLIWGARWQSSQPAVA